MDAIWRKGGFIYAHPILLLTYDNDMHNEAKSLSDSRNNAKHDEGNLKLMVWAASRRQTWYLAYRNFWRAPCKIVVIFEHRRLLSIAMVSWTPNQLNRTPFSQRLANAEQGLKSTAQHTYVP